MKDDRQFREEDKIKSTVIGKIKCPECNSQADYIERKGKWFLSHFSKCKCGKCIQLDKEILDFWQIGDKVRYYNTSFSCKILFDSYVEGIIIAKEKWPTDYHLSIKVFKRVLFGKEIKVKDEIIEDIDSTDKSLELLSPLQIKMPI